MGKKLTKYAVDEAFEILKSAQYSTMDGLHRAVDNHEATVIIVLQDARNKISGALRALKSAREFLIQTQAIRFCQSCESPIETEAPADVTLCNQCWKSRENIEWFPGAGQ